MHGHASQRPLKVHVRKWQKVSFTLPGVKVAPAADQRAALQAVQLDAGRARAQDLRDGRVQAQLGAAQLPARAAVRAAAALPGKRL